jgi:hypothetical protein
VKVAPDVDHRLGNGHLAPKDVDPLGPEAEELVGPQTAVGGEEDNGPIAGVHSCGEPVDVSGREEAHFDSFDPWHLHAVAGRRCHKAGLDGRTHDL